MGLLRRSPRLLAKESARQTPRSSPRLQAKASASQNAPAIVSRPTAARKACHQAPSKPGRGGGRRRFGETKVPGVWAGGTCHLIRRDIRKIVKGKIVDASGGDPTATMYWNKAWFHQRVYVKRQLDMKGWEKLNLPFRNLSHIPGGKESLLRIRDAFLNDEIYFVKVSQEELSNHVEDILGVGPAIFEPQDIGRHHPGRSDQKKSRFNHKTGEPVSKKRRYRPNGVKTPKYVRD